MVVALPSLKNHFEPSLKALRQVAGQAQIILLAQMLEEPLLIEHLNRNRASLRLFDDYLISPMRFEEIAKAFRQAAASTEEQMSESEKDRRIEELEKLVIQDDLTGLKNRRYLYHFLPQILALAEREQLRVTFLLFDIDDFKHYNDALRPCRCDNVLRQTARMIQRCCRSHDVVARLGGDEFAVVFWDLPAENLSFQTTRRANMTDAAPNWSIRASRCLWPSDFVQNCNRRRLNTSAQKAKEP